MRTSDQMLARVAAEIEEKQTFIDGIVEDAEKDSRDLTSQEMEMVTRARDRAAELGKQAETMADLRRIGNDSAQRLAEIQRSISADKPERPREVEYRTAGEYILDHWRASLGHEQSREKLALYARAAAHQTTADNAGLLPAPILGPVVNFVDAARPLVSALGPRQLPGTGFSRPKVTQHTAVLAQSAEKAELTSQKMTITKLTVTPVTYGGYVNVSRQDIDWSQPQIMDIVINDLAAQYAIKTEDIAVDAFVAGGTAATTNLATGTNTADQVAAAIWGAAGQVYAGTKGVGRLIAAAPPQMLSQIGPLFAPVNPVDAQSPGFSASDYGQGALGTVSGIPVYITSAMADNKIVVMSTAAAEVYEERIGSLQVVEPSVLGVQVAYAGYFAPLIVDATGIIVITKTP